MKTATRPAYRPYVAVVKTARRLSPHFARVTFTCPDFEFFGTDRRDQRVKLVLPGADGRLCDIGQHDPEAIDNGEWYTRWRDLPEDERMPFRTYTVRRIDPDALELDIDFVLHHDAGPAGTWAESAAAGESILVVGPDARSDDSAQGIDFHPGTAQRLLLAGDETAAPAICAILEGLGPGYVVDAFVEVPTIDDALSVGPGALPVTWLARDDRPHGEALIEAVEAWAAGSRAVLERAAAPRPQELEDIDLDVDLLWDSPADGEGEFYAWIAGESQAVKTLRRLLVQGHGVDRKRVAFMGYWRDGQVERTA
ncbi:NADPH-dependent ferric siderophore reductase, contains FAD-binding and SIP domains [Microbacterium sp. ru370.1]|uniref:siderophore-interacting protein n=1 Tax=unclassified Microbacterium TaxID=2609290 RepID=UPI0008856B6B|nr:MULTISPECIES: siderophore-interacting protein [unclassified Microbacterium]SDO73167.1 NADPH-dependent ferric siderophore reductase, contains FAD-binding and SIP domains [Microbacterium sp. ru370.1]SIT87762.1 NADPH-dependent ferric siderophore reductase, contains FAD-binding and SIP domains [Microbacterium sp. RU1D]